MQFRDLRTQYQILKPKIDTAIQNVLNEGSFIMGSQVKELEDYLAAYVGARYCLTCANGTDALTMVLMAWDIKAGDAVFVDVDADTFNIDPNRLENVIKETLKIGQLKPRAIIPVDLFGLPANYPEIKKIARKYGLLILEDGAQGFGGMLNGQRACSFGNAATTSFFPAKPLGCYGDGGAVFTNDGELAEKIESIRMHGKGNSRYDNVRIGMNSRLDTIQAAILQIKFQAFIDYELKKVNQIAQSYSEKLKGIVKTPSIPAGYYSSWAQYTIQLENKTQRDTLQNKLKEQGIPSMIYYPKPMHRQSAFAELSCTDGDYIVTEYLCDRVLSLPIHPYLEEGNILKVCKMISSNT